MAYRPVWAALSVALALGLVPGLGSTAARAESWGAVMVGPYGAYGWSTYDDSEWQAEQNARSNCEGQCTQGFTFYDTCGAIAVGGGEEAYWGTGYLQEIAEDEALSSCEVDFGYSCEIHVWACSN